MRLSYLKEFVALANYSKLTAAARALHMSPSTLSQHLAALEKETGCELFSRDGGFTLTREGEMALEHAQRIIFEYDELLRDCVNDEDRVVRLSIPNMYVDHAPVAIARDAFLDSHPGARVVLSSNLHQLEDPTELLRTGMSDVSYLFLVRGSSQRIEDVVPKDIAWMRVGEEYCQFACSPYHPKHGQEVLSRTDLNNATVITALCPLSSLIADGLNEVLQSHGVSVRTTFRRLARNIDALLEGLDREFVLVLNPTENSAKGVEQPWEPASHFETDLFVDVYALYRPDSLTPLQREYLDLAKSLHEGTVSPVQA